MKIRNGYLMIKLESITDLIEKFNSTEDEIRDALSESFDADWENPVQWLTATDIARIMKLEINQNILNRIGREVRMLNGGRKKKYGGVRLLAVPANRV